MVYARLVLWRCCQDIALQRAMYHMFKFYVATWDAIRMGALTHSASLSVLRALASYVMSRTSSLSVLSWSPSK